MQSPLAPFCLLLVCAAGCGAGAVTEQDAVARAYDDLLTRGELRQVIPMESTPEDSMALAKQYIDNWLRDRVLMFNAEQNLSLAQKDVEAELQAYRRSLILHAYEQALIDEKLDTAVSASEVELYYRGNEKNFVLKDDIVRVRWFKVREDDRRTLERIEDLWRSDDQQKLRELEIWRAQRGIGITDTGEDWTDFNELLKEVPIETANPTDFLAHAKKIVVKDSVSTYFVDLLEHRLRTAPAPLQRVAPSIRAIIINQRKLRLLEGMRNDLYDHARANKDVELLH